MKPSHENFLRTPLEALTEIRKQQQQACDKAVKGTLQLVRMHPNNVALFNENLIRIFHERAKHDLVYVDVTGRGEVEFTLTTVSAGVHSVGCKCALCQVHVRSLSGAGRTYYRMEHKSSIFQSRQNFPYCSAP